MMDVLKMKKLDWQTTARLVVVPTLLLVRFPKVLLPVQVLEALLPVSLYTIT